MHQGSFPLFTRTLLASVVLGAAFYPQIATAGAAAPGGSNYHWFNLGPNCDREPYGVLKNYHLNVATIRSQLAQMRAAGQSRIVLGIFFGRGLSSGTLIDSTGGNIAQQYRDNLQNLLSDVRAAGFGEVLFRFFPQGANSPIGWSTYSEDLFQENWNLVYNLRPILAASGLLYRIDLGVEESPPDAGAANVPSYPAWSAYVRKMWANYVFVFGKADTLGFSVSVQPDIENRVRHMSYVYNGDYPYLFGFDMYGGSAVSESQLFQNTNTYMNRYGFGAQGWIISEAFYNDATAAFNFSSAIAATGRTVFYLSQWPLQRSSGCTDVSVSPPTSFSNYSAYGF